MSYMFESRKNAQLAEAKMVGERTHKFTISINFKTGKFWWSYRILDSSQRPLSLFDRNWTELYVKHSQIQN